jgi:SAM-dependent methyltransferase
MNSLLTKPADGRLSHYQSARCAVDKLRIEPWHAVLDLGCGEGFHFGLASEAEPRVLVAADISFKWLRTCAARHAAVTEVPDEESRSGGAAFVAADALRLPFASESFDRIICSLVLYLLPLEVALRELARILVPGGKAYVRVPMLSWGRAMSVFAELPNVLMFAYGVGHVLNGLYFSLIGRQCEWSPTRACYLPQEKFAALARQLGLEFDDVHVDRSRRWRPSIDAWLSKPAKEDVP